MDIEASPLIPRAAGESAGDEGRQLGSDGVTRGGGQYRISECAGEEGQEGQGGGVQQRHPPKTGVLLIRITLRATLSPRPVTHCQNLNYSRPCGGTVPASPAVPAGAAAASCRPRGPGHQGPRKEPSSFPLPLSAATPGREAQCLPLTVR